jgi:DNA mismatch repair protein MutH
LIVLASQSAITQGASVYDYDIHEPSSIERYAKRLVHREVGEMVDVLAGEQQGTYTKGSVGRYVETYFGIEANSDAEPDFASAGVELKTVPLQRRGRELAAKERTFITAIGYRSAADQLFEGSPLDLKTRHTLYVFYEWQREIPIARFEVLGVLLHERDDLDELMLRDVHSHVQAMVRQGRAHEISEGDTWGAGAATKDAGGKYVDQPFGSEPARRRAYAYKPPYTTRLWQLTRLRETERAEAVDAPGSMHAFVRETEARVEPWTGATVAELLARFAPDLNPAAKNATSVVSRSLLGSEGRRTVEAFDRLGITIRAIRVDPASYLPYEDVSFPAFHPEELVEQEWESSDLLDAVSSIYFMVFAAYPAERVVDARLLGGFFWRPDTDELGVMGREWTALRDAFAASRPEAGPRASETQILHIRPHARNREDTLRLPSGRPYVRSSYWLNRAFVGRLVAAHLGGHADRRS